jgi:hypothetical protein
MTTCTFLTEDGVLPLLAKTAPTGEEPAPSDPRSVAGMTQNEAIVSASVDCCPGSDRITPLWPRG